MLHAAFVKQDADRILSAVRTDTCDILVAEAPYETLMGTEDCRGGPRIYTGIKVDGARFLDMLAFFLQDRPFGSMMREEIREETEEACRVNLLSGKGGRGRGSRIRGCTGPQWRM